MSILDRFRLDGRRLFITGGSRGLGREMALAIADAGADVILVGRDVPSLEATAADIRKLGREAFTLQGNVCDTTECQEICQRACSEFGPIDILINHVGGRRYNMPTEELPPDRWQEIIVLNLTSTFRARKITGGEMINRSQGGR